MSSKHEKIPSRWWIAVAVPFVAASGLFWWGGDLALQAPDDGTDARGMAAMSMFVMSVGSLGMALVGAATLFLLRWQARSSVALPDSHVSPPGWYLDPWGQASTRWWDGFKWTGHVN